jgi:uncharacterized protein
MTERPWRESVVAYIAEQCRPVDKFGHQPRLYHLACQIAEGEGCDDDVLFAAAWMHDLGVFLGHRPSDPAELAAWDHVPYTLKKSRNLLLEWGFPASKLASVEEAIRTHQAKDYPVEREAIVLRDADILEQLGAVGVLRSVTKIGRDTRFSRFSDVVPVLERALNELPSQLRLERSRALARDRVACLAQFLGAIRSEAGNLLH